MLPDTMQRLEDIIKDEIKDTNSELIAAVRNLLEFKTECIPEHFTKNDGYQKGDEDAPFFSQTFLYTLLGKEDARTLLALMRPVWKAAGIDRIHQP